MDRNKIIKFIQVIGWFIAITGLTLFKLWGEKPYFLIVCAFVFFLLIITQFLSWKDCDLFTKKSKIDNVWQDLIKGAEESIEIFAGDVSWIGRDKDTIDGITDKGIMVSVVCHNPGNNKKLQENISNLIYSGAKVKFFNKEAIKPPYGIIIDKSQPASCTALIVDRSPAKRFKKSQNHIHQKEIYDYTAKRILSDDNYNYLLTLSALFDSMWKVGIDGCVLKELNQKTLPLEKILMALRKVKLYESLKLEDISLDYIDISNIYASCNYVKMEKLKSTRPIASAYLDQNIQIFRTSLCVTCEKTSILLPPILEVYDGKRVIIDGVHRLYNACNYISDKARSFCVILKNQGNLPGDPFPFAEVKAAPNRLDREKVFKNYRPQYYRDFSPMDDYLSENDFVYDIQKSMQF